MIVGFTGTRDGMTGQQRRELRRALASLAGDGRPAFHHGDCIGADAEAVFIARKLRYLIVTHPPTDDRLRAFAPSDLIIDPEPYLKRNRTIVDTCAVLIATPKEAIEQLRSGTWSTVRYALSVSRHTIVIQPSGLLVTKTYNAKRRQRAFKLL